METFLEVPERALQGGFVPQDVTRQGTRSGRVVPVFAHPCMTINLSLTTRLILVLCEIRLALLPKRHGLCRAIRLLKHRIPLLGFVVRATQGLQTKTTTACGLGFFDHGNALCIISQFCAHIFLFLLNALELSLELENLFGIALTLRRNGRILYVSHLFIESQYGRKRVQCDLFGTLLKRIGFHSLQKVASLVPFGSCTDRINMILIPLHRSLHKRNSLDIASQQ